jgi:dsRNA-specific ribonuclease
MVTKFEETLGIAIPDRKLRVAICNHKSIIHPIEAINRLGYEQESLASLGDRLISLAVHNYNILNKSQKIKNSLVESNRYMYYFVQDTGLAKFCNIDKDCEVIKTIYHEYGTFFEAIIGGLYLSHGFNVVKDYLLYYFDEMSISIFLEKKVELSDILKILETTHTSKYFILKNKLLKKFKNKPYVEQLKTYNDYVFTVRISYYTDKYKRKRKFVIDSHKELEIAVEKASHNALNKLNQYNFS